MRPYIFIRIYALFFFIFFPQLVIAESIANQLVYTEQQANQYYQQNIVLSGALTLAGETSNGQPLIEFSGLAWDKDEAILYALSDRGFFISLKPIFEGNKLVDIKLLDYYSLHDKQGKPVKYKFSDSEGLALFNSNNGIKDDTQLIVSFERRSRIIRYDVNGVWQESITLPEDLTSINNFRSENKSLEALTEHPDLYLLAGSEKPLEKQTDNLFAIPTNQRWSFEPDNQSHGSLVGLTTLGNNHIIALERSFPGIFAGITNTLHLLQVENQFQQHQLVTFKPAYQLFNDNFEGIAWHKGNYFFMISDDNDNVIQRSLLIYFAINNLNDYLE
ncbi:MAG: esterase-like activity of phytase family protein [Pseudomonadota bacterium]